MSRHPMPVLLLALLPAALPAAPQDPDHGGAHAHHAPAMAQSTPGADGRHATQAPATEPDAADPAHAHHQHAQESPPMAHAHGMADGASCHSGHPDAPAAADDHGHRALSHAAHGHGPAREAATGHDPHASHRVPAPSVPTGGAGHAAAGHAAAAHDTRPSPSRGHARPHNPATHAPGHHAHPAQALPREPIPVPTDADRAAAFPPLRHGHVHGGGIHSLVRVDRLEAWDAAPGAGQAWELQGWVGGDVQRLWLRSEGERQAGHLASADLELLYGRGTGAWWDVVAGVRQDFGPGDNRRWAAIGVQGMAPYKLEVAATAYFGSGGQSALRAEVEYELPLGARLVLEPQVELEFHGRDDPRHATGTGLSSAEGGLRLRWVVTPRVAPYLGLVHERSFGDTRRYRQAADGHGRDTHWVAGLRWWF